MSELNSDSAKLRAEFVRLRGYWNLKWESVLRMAPDYFETYLDMCAVPWRTRSLPPR